MKTSVIQTKATSKCYLCRGDRWLTRCRQFKKKFVEQRLTFVRKKGLCENCFQPGHTMRSSPKNSYCKIPTCRMKHLTFLHLKSPDRNHGNLTLTKVHLRRETEVRLDITIVMRRMVTSMAIVNAL